MINPWLSVLIPTYNGETYLAFTLDSILKQRDTSIECIVVDDGSTDATLSIIETYKAKLPIKLLRMERKGNWVANTNHALSVATGEFACFLHQDDIWLDHRLSVMKKIIDQFPGAGLYIHASNFIDHMGKYLGVWHCPLRPVPERIAPTVMTGKLLIQNFIPILAPIFRRDLALDVGGLDETLWYTADWDFWLKISSCSETIYYPKPLSGYRVQSTSQTFVRSSYTEDFKDQLEKAFQNNLSRWKVPDERKDKVSKIAYFSIEVNTALAGVYHGKGINLASLLFSFALLGPLGWYRYLQNSRIWERASARVKTRLINR